MSRCSSNKSPAGCIFGILFLVVIVGFLLFVGPTACTDEIGTRQVLTQQGYKDITITGYRFFGGGDGDTFKTGFEATSPTGQRVSGVVTSGWLKGKTVRFD